MKMELFNINRLFILLTIISTVFCNEDYYQVMFENKTIIGTSLFYINGVMKQVKGYLEKLTDTSSLLGRTITDLFTFKDAKKENSCSNIIYVTEANLLETLVKELLNNMYINKNLIDKTSEKDSCNKIQSWIENLIDKTSSESCNNTYVNNKLFDVISVLCKHTNLQVQNSINHFIDSMKPREELINECINLIRAKDFLTASRKFVLIDELHTTSILKQVYNESENNFNLILTFFGNVSNVHKGFIAYKFLFETLENSINEDISKIYKLYENLNRIYNRTTYPNIEPNITLLKLSIENRLTTFVGDKLYEKFNTHNKDGVIEKDELLGDIYRHYKDIYFEGDKLFVDLVCENSTCDPIKLMNFARRRHFHGGRILALNSIYEKINLTENEMLTLGCHIHYMSKKSSSQKYKVENLKENLPKSIKNLLFSKYVCIRNVAYNEYLIADNITLNNNNNNNNNTDLLLFTLGIKYVIQKALWKMENTGMISCDNISYRIKNLVYNKALHASDKYDNNYSSNNRNVIIRDHLDYENFQNDLWEIEPHSENCFIKNVAHNTYMYADDNYYNNKNNSYINKRKTVTWISNHSKITAKNFQWFIEDCSDGIYWT